MNQINNYSQARVQEELDGIFGNSSRPCTSEDLRRMKVLENCLKEAMRLYPAVPFIARELKQEAVVGQC